MNLGKKLQENLAKTALEKQEMINLRREREDKEFANKRGNLGSFFAMVSGFTQVDIERGEIPKDVLLKLDEPFMKDYHEKIRNHAKTGFDFEKEVASSPDYIDLYEEAKKWAKKHGLEYTFKPNMENGEIVSFGVSVKPLEFKPLEQIKNLGRKIIKLG